MENTYTISAECAAYSEFRRNWRSNYKKLSKKIRAQKREIKRLYQDEKPLQAGEAQSFLSSLRCEARACNEALAKRRSAWNTLLFEGHQWRVLNQSIAAE